MIREDIEGLKLSVSRVQGKVSVGFMIGEEPFIDKEVIQRMYPTMDISINECDFITQLDYEKSDQEFVNYSHQYLYEGTVVILINNIYRIEVKLDNDKYQIDKLYNIIISRLRTVVDEIDRRLASEPDINYRIPIVLNRKEVQR